MSVGLGEWFIMGDGYGAYAGRMFAFGGGSEKLKLAGRATGPLVVEGESGVERGALELDDDDGTC